MAVMLFSTAANAELKKVAILMFLDKVTAKTSSAEVPVGRGIKFENLYLKVARCDKKPPEDIPESAAYLTVRDNKDRKSVLFQGWIFASNPSINGLEHAVYDVWLKDCKDQLQ